MKTHVVVVPSDGVILVDGEALSFVYSAPDNIHAIQWHDGLGHIEFTDFANRILEGQDDYTLEVQPYVLLWEAERDRVDAEVKAILNSKEYRADRVRGMRDRAISQTDYLLMPDYKSPNGRSISEDTLASVENYRQELRNITNKPGFPWDGGGENTPWPVKPAGVK